MTSTVHRGRGTLVNLINPSNDNGSLSTLLLTCKVMGRTRPSLLSRRL